MSLRHELKAVYHRASCRWIHSLDMLWRHELLRTTLCIRVLSLLRFSSSTLHIFVGVGASVRVLCSPTVSCPLSGMHGWCKSFIIKRQPFPPPTHQQALDLSSMASAAAGEGPGRHGSHGHNGRGVDGGSFPVRVFVGTALSGDGDGGDKDASHVVVATNSGERSLCYQYTISFPCGRFILNVKSSNTAHFYCEPNNSVS